MIVQFWQHVKIRFGLNMTSIVQYPLQLIFRIKNIINILQIFGQLFDLDMVNVAVSCCQNETGTFQQPLIVAPFRNIQVC